MHSVWDGCRFRCSVSMGADASQCMGCPGDGHVLSDVISITRVVTCGCGPGCFNWYLG